MENNDDMLELNARLSAQRFLLEQLYANAFLNDAPGFDTFMSGALAKVQQSTRSSPMPDDYAQELQARVATHLQRFGESVAKRLRQR